MFDTFSKVKGFCLFICVICHDFNDLKKKKLDGFGHFSLEQGPRRCREAACRSRNVASVLSAAQARLPVFLCPHHGHSDALCWAFVHVLGPKISG